MAGEMLHPDSYMITLSSLNKADSLQQRAILAVSVCGNADQEFQISEYHITLHTVPIISTVTYEPLRALHNVTVPSHKTCCHLQIWTPYMRVSPFFHVSQTLILKHTVWLRIYQSGSLVSLHHVPIHEQDNLSNVVVLSANYRMLHSRPHHQQNDICLWTIFLYDKGIRKRISTWNSSQNVKLPSSNSFHWYTMHGCCSGHDIYPRKRQLCMLGSDSYHQCEPAAFDSAILLSHQIDSKVDRFNVLWVFRNHPMHQISVAVNHLHCKVSQDIGWHIYIVSALAPIANIPCPSLMFMRTHCHSLSLSPGCGKRSCGCWLHNGCVMHDECGCAPRGGSRRP